MTKNRIFVIAAMSSLAWFGCKEQIPAGLNLNPTTIAKDTTFITSTVPTAQLKNMLIEEFTGVRCSNCPSATAQIKQLQTQYNPRLLVVKIHSTLQATPVEATDPSFICNDADGLFSAFGTQSKPSAGIDRLPKSATEYWHNIAALSGRIASQVIKTTPININLITALNAAKDSITLTTDLTFTAASSNKYNYHVYVLENDVEATQDSFQVATLQTVPIHGYIHEEILRASITPVFVGTPLPDSSQVPGRVYRKILQFAKPTNMLNINNGEVVFFITDAVSKEVVHCQRQKL